MSFLQLAQRIDIDGLHPLTVSGIGSQIKYFGAVNAVVPPSISPSAVTLGFLPMLGNNAANGKRTLVRAAGDFQAGADVASPSVTIGLYVVKQPVVVSGSMGLPASESFIALASYQHPAVSSVCMPWLMLVNLQSTTNSGILQGDYTIQIDNESIQTGSISSLLSNVNMDLSIPFALAVGVTFSVSGGLNTASMYQFDLSC